MRCVKNTATAERKNGRMMRMLKSDSFQCYTIAAVPLLLVFLFCYVPMFGIIIAFKNYRFDLGIFGSEWVGFENFKFLVLSRDFPRITWNTIYMNILFIVIGTTAAVGLGVLLYHLISRRATKTYQTILITPHFLSWVVVSYMAYAILHPQNGLLNVVIEKLGGTGVDWYSTPGAWPPILVIFAVWKGFGMDSVIYYATLMGVDSTLYEAAEIDGANRWKVVKHIMIPSLVPIITILGIMKIGGIFRADFGLFYQLSRDVGALYETTDVIDTYIFRTMRVIGDMGLSSAAGLLQSVVGFILVIITNAVVKKVSPDNSLF